jgi:hypothetical protein
MNLETIGSINIINIILGLTIISCYFGMHFVDMASFGSRVAGRVISRAGLGTTLQLSIMTLSKFALVPFLPVLGFLVESGILIEDYIALIIISFLFTFLGSVFILLKLDSFQRFFQKLFHNYENSTIPIALFKTIFNMNQNLELKPCKGFSFDKIIFKKTLLSCFAYIFIISGFFAAFMLGILYPENRLTLSQLTATFHGVGTIIFAVYLDPMLSRSIDLYDDDITWINNVYSIILGRVISYFIVLIALSIFLFIQII